MPDFWLAILQAFWFIAPAYIANGFPPVMQGRKPIDMGKKIGKVRALGGGKTFEGTAGGIIAGILFGSVQIFFQDDIASWNLGLGLHEMTLPLVFLLSVGALAGDVAGSFIKRRLGVPRGGSTLLLDQLGFLLVAIVFASAVAVPEAMHIIILLILTPPIHWLTNVIGYYLKFKRNPW